MVLSIDLFFSQNSNSTHTFNLLGFIIIITIDTVIFKYAVLLKKHDFKASLLLKDNVYCALSLFQINNINLKYILLLHLACT